MCSVWRGGWSSRESGQLQRELQTRSRASHRAPNVPCVAPHCRYPSFADVILSTGVSVVELDVWKDTQGGRFRYSGGKKIGTGDGDLGAAMAVPGWKIMHIPDVDYNALCHTLDACLLQLVDCLARWDAPLPLIVSVEYKAGSTAGDLDQVRLAAVGAGKALACDVWGRREALSNAQQPAVLTCGSCHAYDVTPSTLCVQTAGAPVSEYVNGVLQGTPGLPTKLTVGEDIEAGDWADIEATFLQYIPRSKIVAPGDLRIEAGQASRVAVTAAGAHRTRSLITMTMQCVKVLSCRSSGPASRT